MKTYPELAMAGRIVSVADLPEWTPSPVQLTGEAIVFCQLSDFCEASKGKVNCASDFILFDATLTDSTAQILTLWINLVIG